MSGDRPEPPPVHLPMVCVCDPGRLAAANAKLNALVARLEAGSEHLLPHQVDRAFLTTEIVRALSANFGVQLGPISSDMWFLLEADTIDADNNERSVYVQCDRVEDGLRAIYNWSADGGFGRPFDVP
jgi:hypothetical protein